MGSFEFCFRSIIWLPMTDNDMGMLCNKYADNAKQGELWIYCVPEFGFRTSEQTGKWAKTNQMKCNMLSINFTHVLKSLYAFSPREVWFYRASNVRDLNAVKVTHNNNFCTLYILLVHLADAGHGVK